MAVSSAIHDRLTRLQMHEIVFDALETYNLPDLAATLSSLSQLPEQTPASWRH